jgi:hypothetical protein
MSKCSWCSKEILGERVSTFERPKIIIGDGEVEKEVETESIVGFCCNGYAWAFAIESHKIYGMTSKEIRSHLINEHGLISGKPAGVMSDDCFRRFKDIASAFVQTFRQ